MTELAVMMKEFMVNSQSNNASVCSICSVPGHPTDMCPSLQNESGVEQVNMVGSQGQNFQARRNDPFSNTYNPGWRNHPNFRWSNPSNPVQGAQFPQQVMQRPQPPMQSSGVKIWLRNWPENCKPCNRM